MKEILEVINEEGRKSSALLPSFKAGDTVAVHYKINEGNKQRTQLFQGLVIRRKGSDAGQTFTVRKISNNVGVERIFPLYSPNMEKLEVVSEGKVRRAKLYYIRKQKGKIRVKRKIVSSKKEQVS